MTDTNRPDLPDELRAWRTAAAEEFEAAGFTHEDALSLALQGERFLAEQSREERGKAVRAGQKHIRMSAPIGSRFFKAVRPDGTDFHTGTVHWLPADGAPIPEGGWIVEHPHPGEVGIWDAGFYLSVSTVETDCKGFRWPARLLLVEPVGDVWTPHPDKFPRKRAAHAWRVIGELPSWQALGPQGREIETLLGQVESLTEYQALEMCAVWDDARGVARGFARDAARVAAFGFARGAARGAVSGAVRDAALGAASGSVRDAARGAAWFPARDAVLGLLVADVLDPDALRLLVGPWEQVMGPIEVTA